MYCCCSVGCSALVSFPLTPSCDQMKREESIKIIVLSAHLPSHWPIAGRCRIRWWSSSFEALITIEPLHKFTQMSADRCVSSASRDRSDRGSAARMWCRSVISHNLWTQFSPENKFTPFSTMSLLVSIWPLILPLITSREGGLFLFAFRFTRWINQMLS